MNEEIDYYAMLDVALEEARSGPAEGGIRMSGTKTSARLEDRSRPQLAVAMERAAVSCRFIQGCCALDRVRQGLRG